MDIKTLSKIYHNFVSELEKATKGKTTSLPFIVHELSPSPIVEEGEVFQVIVIGGSVYKQATLIKNGKGIEILEKKEEQLTFRTEDEFLRFIDLSLKKDVNVLALNFAYPIEPVFEKGILDGILLVVTKEGGFHGLVGKQVGKEIKNYIFKKRDKRIKVAVANDTVCLLTAGLLKHKEEELASGIVGTGFNMAFFLEKGKLVNLESANFDKFPRSMEGKIIDDESDIPGRSFFEKEVAGAYLYKHFNIIIKEKGINFSPISSTEELDSVSRKNIPQVSLIAQELLKRSAELVSCQIAGVARFKKRNMVFNMEGSLFWKGSNYKNTVAETVKKLVPEYKVDFVEIENSAIIGAAKLIT